MGCSFDSDKDEISSILFSYELRDSIQTFGGVSKITLRVLPGLSEPTWKSLFLILSNRVCSFLLAHSKNWSALFLFDNFLVSENTFSLFSSFSLMRRFSQTCLLKHITSGSPELTNSWLLLKCTLNTFKLFSPTSYLIRFNCSPAPIMTKALPSWYIHSDIIFCKVSRAPRYVSDAASLQINFKILWASSSMCLEDLFSL